MNLQGNRMNLEEKKMRKRPLVILMIGLFLFTACNHSSESVPEKPNTMHPAIVVEGELYYTTGMEMPVEPAEEAIRKVTAVVDHRELPKKEGKSTFQRKKPSMQKSRIEKSMSWCSLIMNG